MVLNDINISDKNSLSIHTVKCFNFMIDVIDSSPKSQTLEYYKRIL